MGEKGHVNREVPPPHSRKSRGSIGNTGERGEGRRGGERERTGGPRRVREGRNVPGGQGRSRKARERTGESGKAKEGEERGHAGMGGDRRRERGRPAIGAYWNGWEGWRLIFVAPTASHAHPGVPPRPSPRSSLCAAKPCFPRVCKYLSWNVFRDYCRTIENWYVHVLSARKGELVRTRTIQGAGNRFPFMSI